MASFVPDVLSVVNLTSNVPSPLLTTVAPVKAGFATNEVSSSNPSVAGFTSVGNKLEPGICRSGTPDAVLVEIEMLVEFALDITSVEGL